MTVFRERHIQTRFTGDLVAVHIFFVGILKRVGKRLSLAVGTGLPQPPWLGRLYTTKLPVTTVPVLNQDGRLTNHPWQANYQVITVSVHSDNHV